MDLNELAFQKLKEIRTNGQGTIYWKKVWLKICSNFSIKKKYCWLLLRDFHSQGRIEFVIGRGIRICEVS